MELILLLLIKANIPPGSERLFVCVCVCGGQEVEINEHGRKNEQRGRIFLRSYVRAKT